MQTTLTVHEGASTEELKFAASVLLDSLGLVSPIEVTQSEDRASLGLTLPSGAFVPQAQLEDTFAAITLQRERDTGAFDTKGRFEEQAVEWDVRRPNIDLEARQFARQSDAASQCDLLAEEPFQVIISHDVDRLVGRELWCLAKSLLPAIGVRPEGAFPLATAFSRRAFADNICQLLDFEVANDIGAYYFMLSGPYGIGRYSSRYDCRWSLARETIANIRQAGMTVGLHGSYYARDRNGYLAEKERLEQVAECPIVCHRNHYLRFDSERIWNQLEAAGIDYDFSLGFSSRLGFRAGSARAHRTFDTIERRPSKVLAIPLLYMDCAVPHDDRQACLESIRLALVDVKSVGGCVSLLFHPGAFLLDRRFRELFEEVVALCRDLGADLSGTLPKRDHFNH